ncbi:MAG: hypothetical protein CL607_20065 [Anaerolineaceae bacterium]|nr:hypothetical protein [Anaerolineaceae bacterium]
MKIKFSFLLVLLLALSLGVQPAVAKKPLTTVTFDEPVVGVSFDNGSIYEPWCSGPLNLCGPHVDGNALASTGTLTLTFDKPTTVIEFGVAVELDYVVWSDYQPWDDVFIVEVYGPGQSGLRETIVFGVTPVSEFMMNGYFTYSGPAIKSIVIRLGEPYQPSGWYLDNLVFHG